MSLSAAATQSKPFPLEEEEFDAAAEEGLGAEAAEEVAGAGLEAAVAGRGEEEEAGEDAAAATTAASLALALGAANGLTLGPLGPVVAAATASAGAANPSATAE